MKVKWTFRRNIPFPSSRWKIEPSKKLSPLAAFFILASYLLYSANLKMEETYSSETSVDLQ
jgi:hypothetical protein